MNKYLLFVLCGALLSCEAIATLQNQKITLYTKKMALVPGQKLLYVPVQIHENTIPMVFDTGAMFSAIYMADSLCPKEYSRAIPFGNVWGADHQKQVQKLVVLPAKSDLFESKNKVFAAIQTETTHCAAGENQLLGILGMDLFFHENYALNLLFSEDSLQLVDPAIQPIHATEKGYVLVPSKFQKNALFVKATTENKTFWFKLDSGFGGTMSVPYSAANHFENNSKTTLVGSAFQTALGRTQGREVFYNNMSFVLGKWKIQQQCVESSSLKMPLLGLRFMQGFDWIFDFKNKKIYAKKNNRMIPGVFHNLFPYQVQARDKLRISLKNIQATAFQLGDEILSVNGQKVTAENLCAMQKLLNSTHDWGQLSLLVCPAN